MSRVLYSPKRVSVIYLLYELPHSSSVLPSIAFPKETRADDPQSMVYANLQPPDETADMSPYRW